ncbi:TonB-dependent receptor [Edaphobacter sp.]|uniref:TonB-dependent receptor n=1 Tax=Edaphobacter sp. TaxID=1934404 RepID=UPI002DB86DC0|nr:TonB-dependent receptor [Edaphobacter sp.]HEU5341786.1 TonB-dependent receptor [Edaphobacter sp.]
MQAIPKRQSIGSTWARSLAILTTMMLGLTLGAVPLRAQTQAFTATLSGTVTDSTGAVIPNTTVTLTSAEKGITRTFTTTASGNYSFQLLPPAIYSLKAQVSGFKGYEQKGIDLAAGTAAHQDIVLSVGGTSQSVEVSSEPPLINADNANISADISQKQIVELPLNLRNVFGLASLNSSVNNSTQAQMVNSNGISGSADQDISFLNFGGTHFGTAAYLLDGTWNTAQDWGGVVYVPSVEGVDEFKIQTNAFTAQYGWSSGNVINVVTKSGTNSFHGDVFEFVRNSALDGNNYFNNLNGVKRPDFHRNQYGGSIGGPVIIPGVYDGRGKTFFYALYEGLRQSTPASLTGTVPTSAFTQGDFSSLLTTTVIGTDALGRPIYQGALYDPYSVRQITAGQIDPKTGRVATQTGYIRDAITNNNVAGKIDPVAAKIIAGKYWPVPTNGNLVNNFFGSSSATAQSDEYSVRVDHNFSDLTRFFARYSHKSEQKTNSPDFFGSANPGGPGVTNPNNRWSYDMGLTHVFSQSLILSANAGMNRWIEQSATQGDNFKPSTLGLPSALDTIAGQFPGLRIDGFSGLGPGAINGQDSYAVPRNYITYSTDITKTLSKQTLQFGFMGVVNQILGGHVFGTKMNFPIGSTAGPDPTNPTQGTGFGFASFLMGVPDNGGATGINAQLATQKNYFGWYVQDDWKVVPRLTVNIGLRYEIQTPLTERHNKQQYFDFNASNPVGTGLGINTPGELVFNGGGNRRGLYNTVYTNFGPRIGLSYQATPKLVARTGYGIFYIPSYTGNGPADGYTQTTPIRGTLNFAPYDTLSNPIPNGILLPQGSALGAMQDVGQGVPAVRSNRASTYLQQWMLGFQYSIRPNDMIDVTYVGNRGVKLSAGGYERDQLNPQYFSMGQAALQTLVPNPFYKKITSSGCGLDQPTVQKWQLLRPFPQYCSVQDQAAPIGDSYYDALQATYTHRFSSGLSVLASYTFSKFIDDTEGNNGWANSGPTSIRNYYDLAAEKSVDGNDIPHSLVVSYIYQLPIGHGKALGSNVSRPVNALIGGWQVSGISTFKQGFPLSIAPANNTLGQWGGGNRRPDIVADMHVAHPSIHQWFNPGAFQDPTNPFDFGSAPRYISTLRAPGYQNWDLAAEKYFHFTENTRLQIRAEMYNAFNHANFYAPNQFLGNRGPQVNGQWTGSFATIGNAFPARDVQFAAKFYW